MNPSTNPIAVRSKLEITAALLQLMKEFKFSEITIKQILAEAQIARKTFYRNFSSKEDVLQAYIEKVIIEYVDKLIELGKLSRNSKSTGLSPYNILRIIFDLCIENKDFLLCLHKNDLMYMLLDQMNNVISKKHTQVVPPDHYLFSGITPEYTNYIISFNVCAVYGTMYKWIETGMTDDTDIIIEQLTHFLKNLTVV